MKEEEFREFIEQELPDDLLSPPARGEEHLPFNKISPRAFEVLCCKLANILFEDARLFGRSGQGQEGIDITAKEKKTQTIIGDTPYKSDVFIQCKRYEKFSLADLKEVFRLFLKGEFGKRKCKFILAVSCNCGGDTNFHKEYRNQKQILNELGIEFVLWDSEVLEHNLKSQPQIVYDTFDRDEHMKWTEAFCGKVYCKQIDPAYKSFPNKELKTGVENYVNRNIYFYKDVISRARYGRYSREYNSLADIVRDKEPKKILLLSAAGAGKSSELKQLEYIFSHPEERLFPIRIQLNDYTVGGIEEFICRYYAHFNKYNPNKILLLFDGYDEIAATDLEVVVRELNQFANPNGRYKNTRIVLSSRSNFYKSTFKGFETYYLDDINATEIKNYVSKVLLNKTDIFFKTIDTVNLRYLLSNAFNLISLVKIFEERGVSNFPKNRGEAFERIIEIKLNNDCKRADYKIEFKSNIVELRRIAELVAISMEQLGRNKISNADFIKIVVDSKSRELLKHSFLVNNNLAGNDEWQFEHNNFQEYLAAFVVSKQSIESIKDLVSFKGHLKIKPRWVNTLSFLFSVLPLSSDKYQHLLSWVTEIEPEIVLKFEREVLSAENRLSLVKSILESYKAQGIVLRAGELHYEEVARFCGEEDIFVEYLLDQIEHAQTSEHLTNCVSILEYLSIAIHLKSRCKTILLKTSQESEWQVFAMRDTLRCYLKVGFNNENDLVNIIKTCSKIDKHDVRYDVYSFLLETDLCDSQIDFLLEGLNVHKKDSRRDNIIGESYALMACIHKCVKPFAIKKILQFAIDHCDDEHKNEGGYYFYRDKKLVSESLIENCIKAFNEDKSILQLMIDLIQLLDKYHDNDRIKSIRPFFLETSTSLEAMKKLIAGALKRKVWSIHALVMDESCVDYVVKEYLKGNVDDRFIITTLNQLLWSGISDVRESLYNKINDATDNKFVVEQSLDWETARNSQHLNDLKLLESKKSFLKEVDRIFNALEKDVLDEDDVHLYSNDKLTEEKLQHTLPLRFLQNIKRKENSVTKAFVHNHLKVKNHWGNYVFNSIYSMLLNNKEIGEWHKDYMRIWFYKKLPKCDFKSAVWYSDAGELTYRTIEYYVAFIWRELNFEIDDETMLELLLFDFSDAQINIVNNNPPEKTLSDYVCERFADVSKLKDEIIKYLCDHTITSEVSGSLIRQCKNLSIHEAARYILDWMMSGRKSKYYMTTTIDIYLELSGTKAKLIDLIKMTDGSQYWHWYLIELLDVDFGDEVVEHVSSILNATEVIEYKEKALKILINAGIENAWDEFKQGIIKNKRFGNLEPRHLDLSKLNQELVAKDLFELLMLSYEKEFKKRFGDFNSEVKELIFDVGFHSEENFTSVMSLFDYYIQITIDSIEKNKSLRYIKKRFENNYYLNKGDSVTLTEVLMNNKSLVF